MDYETEAKKAKCLMSHFKWKSRYSNLGHFNFSAVLE